MALKKLPLDLITHISLYLKAEPATKLLSLNKAHHTINNFKEYCVTTCNGRVSKRIISKIKTDDRDLNFNIFPKLQAVVTKNSQVAEKCANLPNIRELHVRAEVKLNLNIPLYLRKLVLEFCVVELQFPEHCVLNELVIKNVILHTLELPTKLENFYFRSTCTKKIKWDKAVNLKVLVVHVTHDAHIPLLPELIVMNVDVSRSVSLCLPSTLRKFDFSYTWTNSINIDASRCTNLIEMDILCRSQKNGYCIPFPKLVKLKRLSLTKVDLGYLKHTPNLRRLKIVNSYNCIDLSALTRLIKLEARTIVFPGNYLPDSLIYLDSEISTPKFLPNLKIWRQKFNRNTDMCPNLRNLTLYSQVVVESVYQFLRKLEIVKEIPQTSVDLISGLENLMELYMFLHGVKFSTKNMKSLQKLSLKLLEVDELCLNGNVWCVKIIGGETPITIPENVRFLQCRKDIFTGHSNLIVKYIE